MGLNENSAIILGSKESNDVVRSTLVENGDLGWGAREVTHFAYPVLDANPFSAEEVEGVLLEAGFTVEPTKAEVGLAFHHDFDPFVDDFDEITDQMSNSLANLGWSYDGWETLVVRKEDLQ